MQHGDIERVVRERVNNNDKKKHKQSNIRDYNSVYILNRFVVIIFSESWVCAYYYYD